MKKRFLEGDRDDLGEGWKDKGLAEGEVELRTEAYLFAFSLFSLIFFLYFLHFFL